MFSIKVFISVPHESHNTILCVFSMFHVTESKHGQYQILDENTCIIANYRVYIIYS